MDKRQNIERNRANGSGMFSPASRRPLRRSLSKIGKAHAACGLALLALSVPLAALAADTQQPGQTITVVLDVASKGALGALVFAAVAWLKNKRTESRDAASAEQTAKDDAARYATMADLQECRCLCRKDIVDLRTAISENDRQAEARAKGTHSRIDAVYKESCKVNKSLGMLIGIMIGKGLAPASLATQSQEEG